MPYLFYQNLKIPFEKLNSFEFLEHPFISDTLQIIEQWLSNKESFILKTSGSTGTPKEIVFSRDQISRSAQMTVNYFGLNKKNLLL